MMTKFTGWAFWRWVVLAAVTLVFILLIWFVGPRIAIGGIAPLASHTPRLLACLIVLLLAAMFALAWLLRTPNANGGTRERQVALTSSVTAETQQISKAQRDTMERGFHLAMAVLRRVRPPGLFNRTYRYALPWYGVIGHEQAGKSTFIHSSDLRFPLNEGRDGRIAAGPLGFSFTDRAVLIETRGPLVPQTELNTWSVFAALLKRHRAREPINGLILVLSLPDVMRASEVERFSFHADLRDQLEVFQRVLKLRVPVYVVFTKADEIPGFRQFCSDLTLSERRGVFGITLPLYDEHGITTKGKPLSATFATEYDHFIQWQLPRVIGQMKQAFSVEERFDCFMFLPHLATLKAMINDLIEDVFKPTSFERPLLLRGIYFTSAIPTANRASNELLPAPGAETAADGRRMGFFIHDLLDKVIFKESGLVEADHVTRRREALLKWGAIGLGGIAATALLVWWTLSFLGNTYLITDLQSATLRAQDAIQTLEASPASKSPTDTDMAVILPTLNALEALPTGWSDRHKEVPLRLGGGLSQDTLLSSATIGEYKDALQTLLQPRMQLVLQNEIAGSMDKPTNLYPALKVYLMLGGAGPMDQTAVKSWMSHYFGLAYPGPSQAALRTSLMRHVDNLLDADLKPIEIDAPLVAEARNALNAYTPANRGMTVLQQMTEVRNLPPWRLTEIAGPLAPYALARRSGRPLSEPIDGMYTSAAFFSTILPAISKVAEDLVGEDWVRFPTSPTTPRTARVTQLRRDITDLYLNDYIVAWQNLISDVTIATFANLQEELAVLQALIGPPSPLSTYLQAAAKETMLAPPAPPAELGKADVLQPELAAVLARSRALGDSVTVHFSDLHRFVTGSPSPLDEVLKSLGQLRALIGPAASSGGEGAAQVTELSTGPAYGQVLSQLKLNTLTAPPALTASILALVHQTSSITDQGVRADLDANWKTQIYPFCLSAINGRYPFANSPNEATLADFARMFAPDGLMDAFFTKHLKPFVDTLTSPWKPLANAGARPNITPQALGYFEQAAKIRTYFFAGGSTAPLFTFGVTPLELDPGAARVRLTIDGQSLTYQYGPQETAQMKWPGAPSGVRIEFGAATMEQPVAQSFTGPWALFRFLAAQNVQRQTANRFNLVVNVGPRSATFVLDAASVDNPFLRSPLPGFRCLPSLMP
ncbi:type VI secretion system membrane subunit TssM [Aquabacter spiritensis]|uniref:Type VI secretion system protein ImpL n=1 Tax=Aquabacter spiritensis TaxID=933073 RepID=A0A4R3LUX3_9HYPH|nr:type VI secretion system membrane subunit TssM [Aquabacter spiritensis]TCT02465.1 type VI secretion system protein ImpL [Aquabacter spiritensis]